MSSHVHAYANCAGNSLMIMLVSWKSILWIGSRTFLRILASSTTHFTDSAISAPIAIRHHALQRKLCITKAYVNNLILSCRTSKRQGNIWVRLILLSLPNSWLTFGTRKRRNCSIKRFRLLKNVLIDFVLLLHIFLMTLSFFVYFAQAFVDVCHLVFHDNQAKVFISFLWIQYWWYFAFKSILTIFFQKFAGIWHLSTEI